MRLEPCVSDGRARRPTPRELLAERGQLADDVVAVRIGGRVVRSAHAGRRRRASSRPFSATDPAALEVIRHSAAHVMADAVQRLFPGTQVTIGPAIDTGFYYDFDRPDGAFTDKDLERIEKEMRRIIAAKLPFHREEVTRATRRTALFESMGEKYKLEILDSIPEGEAISHLPPRQPGQSGGQLGGPLRGAARAVHRIISARSS